MKTNNGRLEQMSLLKPLMAKPEEQCGHQCVPGFPECTLPKGHADKWHRHQAEKPVQLKAQLLPCLSIRQPWAWLIVNGWKNVENRTWPTKLRGRISVHASKNMTREDYDACELFIAFMGMRVDLPAPGDLPRGGIVGETTILDCVTHHPSEWFTGPFGFVVDNSKPGPFTPCAGRLGFFYPTLEVAPCS